MDPSSLIRFRKRIGSEGVEHLLQELLMTAKRIGAIKDSHLDKVNIDTTVQEKAIAFPTDARLYYKMRDLLVKAAEAHGITLRQNYRCWVAKKALSHQSGYSRAQQMRRVAKMTRQLKTYLGRVHRDIFRKVEKMDPEHMRLLDYSLRLQQQTRDSKDKLYSIHVPRKSNVFPRVKPTGDMNLATRSVWPPRVKIIGY